MHQRSKNTIQRMLHTWHAGSQFLLPSVLIAGGIILFVFSNEIESNIPPDQLGPKFWPRLSLIGIIVGCIGYIIGVVAKKKRNSATKSVILPGDSEEADWRSFGITIVLIFGYVFFSEQIGFPLASICFLILFMYLWNYKKKLNIAVIVLTGTIVLCWVFGGFAYIPLPKGKWFFEEITIFLYKILHVYDLR